MPQIKSVVCIQACVACWSDVLVKNVETSVYYFLFEAIFRCISRPVRAKKHWGFSQSGQSDFILTAIRAERLRIQTKTRQQPIFTFGKCEEMSSGMVITMNFQFSIKVRIYSQTKRMRPADALP